MSLVNDMLNDLDKRRGHHVSEKVDLEWMAGNTSLQPQRRFMPLVALAFILLLIAIAFVIWDNLGSGPVDAADKLLESPSTRTYKAGGLDSTPVKKTEVDKPEVDSLKVGKAISRGLDEVVNKAPVSNAVTVTKPLESNTDSNKSILSDLSQRPNVQLSGKNDKDLDEGADIKDKGGASRKSGNSIGKKSSVLQSNVNTKEIAGATAEMKWARPLSARQLDLENVRQAKELILGNSAAKAEGLLTSFIQKHPIALESGELLVSLLLSQRKFSEARALLSKLRGSNPHHIGLLNNEARLLMQTQSPGAAVKLLLSERPSVPEHFSHYELLALAAGKNKQYDLSAKVYREILNYKPEHGDWWVGLAIAFDAQANQEGARQAYLRALNTTNISTSLADYARKRTLAITGLEK